MNIALVCSGISILDNDYYSTIDRNDIVYRVNPGKNWDRYSKKHDYSIVSFNLPEHMMEYMANNVIVVGERLGIFNHDICNRNYEFHDRNENLERVIAIKAKCPPHVGHAPTTGLWAVHYLLDKYKNDDIYIYGMDLYRNKNKHYLDEEIKIGLEAYREHCIRGELIIMNDLVSSNDNIHWMIDNSIERDNNE